jgi:ADP-ribosylglycohydrolase
VSDETDLRDRMSGALFGLAAGDSIGGAALRHRTIRLGTKRSWLWRHAVEMDRQHVMRVPEPFTLGRPEPLELSGTDDTEYAVVVANILATLPNAFDVTHLVNGWREWLVDTPDDIWEGVSEASARVNLLKGLLPPQTGNDNPHHYDDSSVARSVPIGIAFHSDPDRAASVAASFASITNAEDGVWAASAFAAMVAHLVRGDALDVALSAARSQIPSGSWTDRCLQQADRELAAADGNAFAAIPGLNDRVVNASYSFGNVAPETLSVAIAILSTQPAHLEVGLGIAAMLPKQSESLPAMIGAALGARDGVRLLPAAWVSSLDRLKGHIVPRTRGLSLSETANQLAVTTQTLSIEKS